MNVKRLSNLARVTNCNWLHTNCSLADVSVRLSSNLTFTKQIKSINIKCFVRHYNISQVTLELLLNDQYTAMRIELRYLKKFVFFWGGGGLCVFFITLFGFNCYFVQHGLCFVILIIYTKYLRTLPILCSRNILVQYPNDTYIYLFWYFNYLGKSVHYRPNHFNIMHRDGIFQQFECMNSVCIIVWKICLKLYCNWLYYRKKFATRFSKICNV
jgi:hypothetical protein